MSQRITWLLKVPGSSKDKRGNHHGTGRKTLDFTLNARGWREMARLFAVGQRKPKDRSDGALEAKLKKTESTAKGKGLRVVKASQISDAGAAKSKFLGTSDIELQLQLMFESTSLMGVTVEELIAGKGLSAGKRVAAAIRGIDPQDELQGLLAVQLFAAHNLAMTFCRLAVHPEQTSEGINANVTRASQFMKLFLEQAACLQKLKGQAGQQKVTVEHVHVHQGGQAIVGAVTPRGEGEG